MRKGILLYLLNWVIFIYSAYTLYGHYKILGPFFFQLVSFIILLQLFIFSFSRILPRIEFKKGREGTDESNNSRS